MNSADPRRREPAGSDRPPRVVLFDLDGTVLTFEGAPPSPGRLALTLAMRDLYGVEGACDGLRFAGGTDRALVRAILRRARLAEEEAAMERVLSAYVVHLTEILRSQSYSRIGDVPAAVAALRSQGALVGVATGNLREGARLKLASAGLGETFDLARGGYGCDAELREDIVRIAASRCASCVGNGPTLIVVGDTEHDVRAARSIGAFVVGVAARGDVRAELAAAGADIIVESCGEALVAAVASF